MTITFYTYTGRRNAITKTLTGGTVRSGNTVPGYQDLSAPVVQVSSDTVPTWNYAYITELGRYYFLSTPRWVSGKVYEYTLQEDVLMTHDAEIRAQAGVVRYSLLGSMGIRDPRISYESKQAITKSTVAIPSQYQTPWYVIRYFNQYLPGSPGTGGKLFSAAFMTAAAYETFLISVAALSDTDRIIVGNCIIDVSQVRYLNAAAVANLTPSMYIDFVATLDDSSLGGGSARVVLSTDNSQLAYICKDPDNAATLGSLTLTVPTTNTGTFWELDALREVFVPYIGSMSFKLADMGASTPSNVGITIAYEPYENVYLTMIRPQIAGAFVDRYPALRTYKVNAAVPFRVDTQYTNMGLMRFQMASTMLGGILGLPLMDFNIVDTLPGAIGAYDRAQFNEQTGYQFIGAPSGDPAYTAMIDGTVATVTVAQAIPREGYTTLWSNKGMPDGAWRAFSALSGYAEIDEAELTGINASADIIDEIRTQLAAGVYF